MKTYYSNIHTENSHNVIQIQLQESTEYLPILN